MQLLADTMQPRPAQVTGETHFTEMNQHTLLLVVWGILTWGIRLTLQAGVSSANSMRKAALVQGTEKPWWPVGQWISVFL